MDQYDDFGYHSMVWYGEWQEWYAWYPVRLFDPNSKTFQGRLRWLRCVKCRLIVTDYGRRWQYLDPDASEIDIGA